MLCLFVSGFFPVQADLGVTFTVGNAGHRQIHADFGALAVEVLSQTLDDAGIHALCNADHMLGCPGLLTGHFVELGSGSLADGALLGSLDTFVNITADGAYKLLHDVTS